MKQLFYRVAILLLAVMAGSLTGCLFRTEPTLVLRTDPATVTRKLQEFAAERGAWQRPATSLVLGQPVGNPRFIIFNPNPTVQEMVQTIGPATEVEVASYRSGLTRLTARTRSPILNSVVRTSNPARESEALRLCADYIERGVKPARVLVLPYDLWQQQTRTNELNQLPQKGVPPADLAKPELKLK